MARNYVQPGNCSVTVPAPAGGVSSGDSVLINNLFGVALMDAAEGEDFALGVDGVYEVNKTSALAVSVGDRLFYVPATGNVNKTATAQVAVGVAVSAAANPSDTVLMKITASTPAGT